MSLPAVAHAADLAYAERNLRAAMQAVFNLAGFTHLHRANADAEADIAKANRAAVALDGWIA